MNTSRLERSKENFNGQANTATAVMTLKRKMTATLKKTRAKAKSKAAILIFPECTTCADSRSAGFASTHRLLAQNGICVWDVFMSAPEG
jgi:hypothetical protein